MGTLKLSQILKYAGIAIGVLGSLKIVYSEVEELLTILSVHWICLIVVGIGALVWFIGAWEAKHESVVATTPSTSTTVIVKSPTTTA